MYVYVCHYYPHFGRENFDMEPPRNEQIIFHALRIGLILAMTYEG